MRSLPGFLPEAAARILPGFLPEAPARSLPVFCRYQRLWLRGAKGYQQFMISILVICQEFFEKDFDMFF